MDNQSKNPLPKTSELCEGFYHFVPFKVGAKLIARVFSHRNVMGVSKCVEFYTYEGYSLTWPGGKGRGIPVPVNEVMKQGHLFAVRHDEIF